MTNIGAKLLGYTDGKSFVEIVGSLSEIKEKAQGCKGLTDTYCLYDELKKLITSANMQINEWLDFVSSLDKAKTKQFVQSKNLTTYAQYKNDLIRVFEKFKTVVSNVCKIIEEAKWLTDKFGAGEYKDILGLCKLATDEEIAEKNYSLTPGAYVGVAEAEDDGVDFNKRMKEIHEELLKLQAESNELMNSISKNMEELGL